jgi:hypothetical protein
MFLFSVSVYVSFENPTVSYNAPLEVFLQQLKPSSRETPPETSVYRTSVRRSDVGTKLLRRNKRYYNSTTAPQSVQVHYTTLSGKDKKITSSNNSLLLTVPLRIQP